MSDSVKSRVKSYRVFISYSRRDKPLVEALVAFLRGADIPVFRDEDSIPSGVKWRAHISTAIAKSKLIYVFWCEHSAESEEVRWEYETGIAGAKRIVPVLITSAPLPTQLGQFNGIDLRLFFERSHNDVNDVLMGKGADEVIFTDITTAMTKADYFRSRIIEPAEKWFRTSALRILEEQVK